ncbi:hypothetical protein SAMN05192574_101963 [Mucilaginibacter gossypiicola]|uniref:Uncharacterized protein n=1 Tax=Mucilaginibacter gossypiicola TaxID=551995 RepID=A0A1H8BNI2_9SPHI|nr:cache domain-containing protein [Mucilaginibacter gossypiicola]SEM83694.1 hypothetical protein SAMN05192574_101963 [Mucilaginibacter gossypiicola]
MFKFPVIGKNQVVAIVTFLTLITLGVSYFYVYVPANEKVVQERRFYCLQKIDNNIHSKIVNSTWMLNNFLKTFPVDDQLQDYLSNYPKTNFTLLPIESRLTGAQIRAKIPASKIKWKDSLVNINTSITEKQLIVFLTKAIDLSDGQDTSKKSNILKLTIGIKYDFDHLIKPLLVPDFFENYIVFESSSASEENKIHDNIIYETFPSGLSYESKDSLLTFKNKVSSPGLRKINIGGKDYRAFSHPINLDGKNQLIVVGLVSAKSYEQERKRLPLIVALLLLTFATGTIISLPWIKLYHTGNKDKLTATDGIGSVLVSILMMSLVFFVFMYFIFFTNTYGKISASSKSLANNVSNALTDELEASYQTLKSLDLQSECYSDDIANLGKPNLKFRTLLLQDSTYKAERDRLNGIVKHTALLEEAFWIDSTGRELLNWSADSAFTPRSYLGWRDYFKKVKSKNTYSFNGHELYLDQIYSVTNETFRSVLAINSKSKLCPPAAVVAMTFTMRSLDHVVMPDGYQFAVINNTGKVLYHSLANRNLNENLKNEFADSTKLISCLEAKSDTGFTANYYGKELNIKIKPVNGLPYFVVIFENQEYNDNRDMQAYAFTIAMLTLLLIFLITQFTIVFFVSAKRSFFKKQLFETSWVGPKRCFHHQYNLIIIVNLIIIICMLLGIDQNSFMKSLYIILFSIAFIGIFPNILFAIDYKRNKSYNFHFKIYAILWLSIFVLLIDIAAFETLSIGNLIKLYLYESILIVFGFIVIAVIYIRPVSNWIVNKIQLHQPKLLLKIERCKKIKTSFWTYTHSFAFMATTRLIITSGIPVAFFFIYSSNYEQNLETRYKHLHFAKDLIQKVTKDTLKNPKFPPGVYIDSSFIHCHDVISRKKKLDSIKAGGKYVKEDFLTAQLLNAFKLHTKDIEIKSNNMIYASVDSDAFFNKLTNTNDTSTHTIYKLDTTSFLELSSLNLGYHPSIGAISHLSYFLPVLVLILLIIGFFFMLHNVIRKLFALGLPLQDGWREMDEQLLLDDKLNSLLLIVGPPGSGKLKNIKNKIKNRLFKDKYGKPLLYSDGVLPTDNVFIADMIRIPTDSGDTDEDWKKCKADALKKSNKLVIINHFEYNIKDSQTNSIKLNFLESLMLQGKSKIMIISTVHPLTFLDSFTEEQRKNNADKQGNTAPAGGNATDSTKHSGNVSESELERWHVLLGHFRIIIQPLFGIGGRMRKKKENPVMRIPCRATETLWRLHYARRISLRSIRLEPNLPRNINNLKNSIIEETRYTHYLNDMKEKAMSTLPLLNDEGIGIASDTLIFKMQISSHYFYTYIWQSLTKEEKVLLYDLAEDGLVNPYDDYNLSLLIYKGLITRDQGTLKLFNKGFRNYILTAIGNSEVERIKAQVKDTGNWSSLKVPLSLSIVGILIFLIVSQQEAYSQILTYITALGAGIPAVLKIISLLGSSGNTQKTA